MVLGLETGDGRSEMKTRVWLAAVTLTILLTVALSNPLFAQGKFQAPGPVEEHQYGELTSTLASRIADTFNEHFVLPRDIYLTSERCGYSNALYYPDNGNGHPQITFCAEMITDIREEFGNEGLSDQQFKTAVVSNVLFIYFHEIGHAFIDVLELPVVGKEEIAADQIATLLMKSNPRAAVWAARYWLDAGNPGDIRILKDLFGALSDLTTQGNRFSDEHSLDRQRFYDILCWTYGADPEANQFIVGRRGLPRDRAKYCERKFSDIESSWERLLEPHLTSNWLEEDSRSSTTSRLTGGAWNFEEAMKSEGGTVQCRARGTITFSRSAQGKMSQTGSCELFGQKVDNNDSASLTEATVQDNRVSFHAEHCHYQGTFDGENEITGTVTCQANVGDRTIELSGSWSASRR